ncbi:MAG: hypothetical protein ACFFD2_00760 [Promethearchaeota archaeon]
MGTEVNNRPIRYRRTIDDFNLFICDFCKRQCAILTKAKHKPPFCPFLKFKKEDSPHIFKF